MTTEPKTPILNIVCDKTVGKRVAKNTGLLVSAKIMAVFMGLATLLITEADLDDQVAFGSILFLHAYMLFFAEVATFQSWQSIIRFGTDDVEDNDPNRLSRLMKFCIKLDGISAILAYTSGVLLFSGYIMLVSRFPSLAPQADGFDIVALKPLVAAYCTVVLFQVTGTPIGILRLFDKFNALAIGALVMPAFRLLGAIIASMQGWGMVGFLCVWWFASVSGYLFKVFLGVFELYRRHLLGFVWRAKQKFLSPRAGLWSFVWKSNIDSTLAAGVSQLPLILVMGVFGPAFVAIYRIAEEFAKLLSEGVKLIEQVIYPELARIMSMGRGREVFRLVLKASVIALGVGMVAAGALYIAGPYLMESSLGEEYRASVPIAVLLVFGAALMAASAPLFPVFYAANKPEKAIYARLCGLVVYVIAFFVLTRILGEIGAPLAVVTGSVAGMIVVGGMVTRTLNGLKKHVGRDRSTSENEI